MTFAVASSATPILVAIIGMLGVMGAAYITTSRRHGRQLKEIHVLVNSRLSQALNRIDALEAILRGKAADIAAAAAALEPSPPPPPSRPPLSDPGH